jgi:hypothetical protein
MPIHLMVLVFAIVSGLAAAQAEAPIVAKPSVNQGRIGIYQAETTMPGCSYYVDANAYVPEQPAGLYLFFHGQNGQDGAKWFGPTETSLLRPHNLIGINMCYADGDNGKDTAGKVKAAKLAIAQVIADYRIVVGRGVVASFSGGGMPLGLWWTRDGAKAGTADFPFTHVSLYSSNFRAAIADTSRTSWFISVGTEEWTLANLGESQCKAVTAVYQCATRKGTIDHDFMISAKGHTIPDEEVARSAAIFGRSDLTLGPILGACEAATPAMQKYVEGANAHAIGATLAALDSALAKKDIDPANATALTAMKSRLETRVAAMTALVERLAVEDPVLAGYYGRQFAAFLGMHEAAKALSKRVSEISKTAEANACAKAHGAFIDVFPKLFTGAQSLDGDHKKLLAQLAAIGPRNSLMARMCREFDILPARN